LTWATVAGGRRYLVLSLAHALYDGWSLGLLYRDVEAAYAGGGSRLARHADYAEFLEEAVLGASSSPASAQFWAQFLADAPSTLIQPDQGGGEQQQQRAHVVRAEKPCSVATTRLRSFCRDNAVSLHALGQACWAAVLASWTGSLDVTFGVVLAGRDSETAQSLRFPTMNTVAMRHVLYGSVQTWLRYVQDNVASVLPFQHFPLREALKRRGARQGRGQGSPLFNSLFIHQGRSSPPPPVHSGAGMLMRSTGEGEASIDYPVCVEMEATDDDATLVWRLACDARYLSSRDAHEVLERLDLVVRYLVDSPTADVLHFAAGERVSICGLPAASTRNRTPDSESRRNQGGPLVRDTQETDEWSETEATIRSVLAQVAAVDPYSVRREHTIYHLGLDSISAIKVASLLRRSGVSLTVRQLLGAQSISDMARLAGERAADPRRTATGRSLSALSPTMPLQGVDVQAAVRKTGVDAAQIQQVLPATPMQVHMLSVWQNTAGAVFFPAFRFSLAGVSSLDTIVAAWSRLRAETPILRTCFAATASRQVPWLQLVLHPREDTDFSVENGVVYLSGDPRALRQPLVSLAVVRRDGARWLLSLRIHHALYDGFSLPILMDRFRALCAEGGSSAVDVADSSTASTDAWKRLLALHADDARVAARRQFWTRYLDGMEAPALFPPRDGARSSGSSSSIDGDDVAAAAAEQTGRTEYLRRGALSASSSSRVQSWCAERGTSLQALCLAACSRRLARRLRGGAADAVEDVVLGVYWANRHLLDDLERLPYPTLCLAPLRVRRPLHDRLATVAARIQEDINRISLSPDVLVGLWEIQDWTGVALDCFVNFLPTGSDNGGGGESSQTSGITIQSLDGPAEGRGARDGETGNGPASGSAQLTTAAPWLSENPVRDAYPDAVDIEAAVTDTGIDIGVFGPERLVGREDAARLTSGLVELLEDLEGTDTIF
ncbi:hypothetical protein VTK73DRAFT_10130, partial [Phialemonium thermophilum]